MTTKNILTLIGAILGLQAIGVFLSAEAITTEAFAALEPTETGVQIGTMLHEVLAVMNGTVAIILLAARNLEPAAGAKVLLGASVGLLLTLGHGFYNIFTTEVAPPMPVLVLMTVLIILGLATALKHRGESA